MLTHILCQRWRQCLCGLVRRHISSVAVGEENSSDSSSSDSEDDRPGRQPRPSYPRPSWPGLSFKQGDMDVLYPGHIPTTVLQKVLLGVGTGVMSFWRPERDDMIAYFGESTGYLAVRYMRNKMLTDNIGRQILREKPRINSSTVDLERLAHLPQNTLGYAYHLFLEKNGVTPDSRRPVAFIDDEELAYVMQRYREVHDLNHTVLGMRTNMLGEVVVKWYEGIQTGLPLGLLGGLFSPLRFGPVFRRRYLETYWAWSVRNGFKARFFMNVFFEKHFEEDLRELRQRWNINEPPVIEKRKSRLFVDERENLLKRMSVSDSYLKRPYLGRVHG